MTEVVQAPVVSPADIDIVQPMPKKDFSVQYICRYECEVDRQLILNAAGHYIEEVMGDLDILFIKAPMEAINKAFKVHPRYPGEEIEFTIDYRKNNIVPYGELTGDELPPLWSVLFNDDDKENGELRIITTIEPCKFILRKKDIRRFEALMATVEIAPKEYNHDALDSVHWNELTAILKQDIEFFVASKRWFKDKGLPYNRSYLLHGPPGNGKTTTIKAISKFLNTKPELFDFVAQYQSPDKAFQGWVIGESERIAREEGEGGDEIAAAKYDDEDDDDEDDDESPTPIRLLVLEDIDRFFPKEGPPQTTVSLSCILNSLDGSVERRNTIIVATANHPENLDQKVFARPGRFDKQVFYEHPDLSNATSYLKKLFEGEPVSEEMLLDACMKLAGHSYALHKELFATSASYAFARKTRVIDDEDVKKGLDDLIKSIDKNALKSEQNKFGF